MTLELLDLGHNSIAVHFIPSFITDPRTIKSFTGDNHA